MRSLLFDFIWYFHVTLKVEIPVPCVNYREHIQDFANGNRLEFEGGFFSGLHSPKFIMILLAVHEESRQ